jgi:hypothetical protein
MFDIEENERREVLALMGREELPTPDEKTRAALVAAGVDLGPSAPGSTLIAATLPPRWRKDQAEVDRAFWLIDGEGRRRFRVWWKAAHPFAFESGSGGIIEAQRCDDYARRWSPDDSFEVTARGERRFEISCPRCDKHLAWTLSLAAERDRPGMRARVEEMTEHAFAKAHPVCPAEQRRERAPVESSFAEWLAAHPTPER